MLKIHLNIWFMILAFLLNHSSAAQENQSKPVDAKKIFETIEQKHSGYGALRAFGEMVLSDASGRKSIRRLESELLEEGENKIFSLLTFIAPKELFGTKLLTHYHKLISDKQWLYLPALKRTRKIVGSTKTNSFLGSEFTYEDLTEFSATDYSYEWVKQDICNSLISSERQECEIIDRYPRTQDSGYSKIRTYVDTTNYHIHKSIFFDNRGKELKTLHIMSYALIDGRVSRIRAMNMTNNINHRQTVLTWKNIEIDETILGSTFEKRRLQK